MLPYLLFLLLGRYFKAHPLQLRRLFRKRVVPRKEVLLLLMGTFLALGAGAQEHVYTYSIMRNGSPVGTLQVQEVQTAARVVYRMQTQVKSRLLFSFSARSREEAVYENDCLVYSSLFREVNGREKANRRTRLAGKNYLVEEDGKKEWLGQYPIRYGMLSLYTKEPLQLLQVFSDNFQRFLAIEKVGAHQYRIRFPDGNWSEYHYRNGLCVRIRVKHTLYSAEITLNT
jgi:hypothetical protein